MFAVIFEVSPKRDRFDAYLDNAKQLKPELEQVEGFIDNERFASQRRKGCILSLSTWSDEKALVRWRTLERHHEAQRRGRFDIFEDYHLRVGEIIADSHVPAGHELTSQRLDETEVGRAKVITITELSPAAGAEATSEDFTSATGQPIPSIAGVLDREIFESIYTPGKLLLLVGWEDVSAASHWQPEAIGSGTLRHRQVRVVRDYGMHDRREAPQYYPPVSLAAAK